MSQPVVSQPVVPQPVVPQYPAQQYPVVQQQPVEHPVQQQHPVEHPVHQQPAPQPHAQQAPLPDPAPVARPGFDAIFGLSPDLRSGLAEAVAPTRTPALRREAAAHTIDTTPTEAEQADRNVGRSSASSRSAAPDGGGASRRPEPAGFDDLFSGLGVDDDEEPGDRRSGRADRKAKKAKSARRSDSVAPVTPGPRRGAAAAASSSPLDDLASLVSGATAAAAETTVQPLAASTGFAAAISAAAGALPDGDRRSAAPTAPAALNLGLPVAATDPGIEAAASASAASELATATDLLGFGPSGESASGARRAAQPSRHPPDVRPRAPRRQRRPAVRRTRRPLATGGRRPPIGCGPRHPAPPAAAAVHGTWRASSQ